MLGRRGYTEETQNQVMFYVVPRTPDQLVLEQMIVYTQDVLSPGAYLQAPMDHAPCTPVTQTWFATWEEMGAHVFHTHGGKGRSSLFFTHVHLWRR